MTETRDPRECRLRTPTRLPGVINILVRIISHLSDLDPLTSHLPGTSYAQVITERPRSDPPTTRNGEYFGICNTTECSATRTVENTDDFVPAECTERTP
ncbi:hypothetical protein [Actinophytocola sp. NPDC049390]|uniref:hypothetical protein n=1 Tax=Actinophytocola sp. NPDC049390 TaxID=3363894 RepID=UPI0037A74A6C